MRPGPSADVHGPLLRGATPGTTEQPSAALVQLPATTLHLAGTVVDESGEPTPGIPVCAFLGGTGSMLLTVRTDTGGRFEFRDVSTSTSVSLWAGDGRRSSVPITLSTPAIGRTLEVGSLTLTASGALVGRLEWEDGTALRGAMLHWSRLGRATTLTKNWGGAALDSGVVSCDDEGRFRVDGLPARATLDMFVEVPASPVRIPVAGGPISVVAPSVGPVPERVFRIPRPQLCSLEITPRSVAESGAVRLSFRAWGGPWAAADLGDLERLDGGGWTVPIPMGWPAWVKAAAIGYRPVVIPLQPGRNRLSLVPGTMQLRVRTNPPAGEGSLLVGLLGQGGGRGSGREVLPALAPVPAEGGVLTLDVERWFDANPSFALSPFRPDRPPQVLVMRSDLSRAWATVDLAPEDLSAERLVDAVEMPVATVAVSCVESLSRQAVSPADVLLLRGDGQTPFTGGTGSPSAPTLSGIVRVDEVVAARRTTSDGRVVIPYLPGLEWRLRVEAEGHCPRIIDLPAGAHEGSPLEVELGSAGSIAVRLASGDDDIGAVCVRDARGIEAGIRIPTESGLPVFGQLASGAYVVSRRGVLDGLVLPDAYEGAIADGAAVVVRLEEGGRRTVELSRRQATGRVRVRLHPDLQAAVLGIDLTPGELVGVGGSVRMSSDARAQALEFSGLPPAEYQVRVFLRSLEAAGRTPLPVQPVVLAAGSDVEVEIDFEEWTRLTVETVAGIDQPVLCRPVESTASLRPLEVSPLRAVFLLPRGDYVLTWRAEGGREEQRLVVLADPAQSLRIP